MIAIDTNVLSIDLLFKHDARHPVAKVLLNKLRAIPELKGLTIYNLLELCGLMFTLNQAALAKKTYQEYQQSAAFKTLYPTFWSPNSATFWAYHDKSLADRVQRAMRLGDAAILWVLEENGIDRFITWNKKHFESRTSILIQTPDEYLANL